MSWLTKAAADLLYATLEHLHDERYSLIDHGHDHGALSGLSDDDHLQYLTQLRGNALYSLLSHVHAGIYSPAGHVHTTHQVLIANGLYATVGAGLTRYLCIGSAAMQTNIPFFIVPFAGTVRNLYIWTQTAQPASGNLLIRLVKNNAAILLSKTIIGGSQAGKFSDLVNSYAIAAGDDLTIQLQNSASGASAQIIQVSFEIEPTSSAG